jgi:hypothetical protein
MLLWLFGPFGTEKVMPSAASDPRESRIRGRFFLRQVAASLGGLFDYVSFQISSYLPIICLSLSGPLSSTSAVQRDNRHFSWRPIAFQTKRAMSLPGPSRHFAATQQIGSFRSVADIQRATIQNQLYEYAPQRYA